MNHMLKRAVLMLLLLVPLAQAWAANAIEEVSFDNEEQLARYKTLIAELRCPMCLNANLAGSDAPIAADLRAQIQRQIQQGRSDDEILAYLVERYGEFILYKPRLHAATALLWFGPPILLLAGFFILRRMLGGARNSAAESAVLSAEEQQQLQSLLQSSDDKDSRHG